MVNTPVGELATIGFGTETSYGTYAPPTVFQELLAFAPGEKTTFIGRPGSVGAPGMRPMPTGPIEYAPTLQVAAVADCLPQLLAYSMGTQGPYTPVAYLTTTVNGNTSAGATSIVLASVSGVKVGMKLKVDTGALQDIVLISAVNQSTNTLTVASMTHAHSTGVAAVVISPTGYLSKYSFGNLTQLPSFSMEYNRGIDCIDYTGVMVETAKFSLESGKGLASNFTLFGQSAAKQASPVTPSLSSRGIYLMEGSGTANLFNGAYIGGQTSPPDVKKWDLTLNNQLDKSRRSAAGGRTVNGVPLGQRKVDLSMTLGFETEIAQQLFWGGLGSGAALGVVPGIPITLTVGSWDYVDTVGQSKVFYCQFIMPNCFISAAPVQHKTSGGLEQVLTISCTESVPGAGDDLAIVVSGTQATAF